MVKTEGNIIDLKLVTRYLEKGEDDEFPKEFIEPIVFHDLRLDLIQHGCVVFSMKILMCLLVCIFFSMSFVLFYFIFWPEFIYQLEEFSQILARWRHHYSGRWVGTNAIPAAGFPWVAYLGHIQIQSICWTCFLLHRYLKARIKPTNTNYHLLKLSVSSQLSWHIHCHLHTWKLGWHTPAL